MDIVLLTRSEHKKEATYITLSSFKDELSRNNHVEVIAGRGIFEHVSEFKKRQKLFDGEFNIIHGFSAAPILALKVILAKRYCKNAKTVQTLKSYSKRFFGGLFFSRILNFVDVVTVPTKVMADKLVKRGVIKKKIRIIRSHIDIERFVPMEKERLKKRYGYFGKRIILYYGSLYKSKGVENLIKAVPGIVEENKDVIVLIAPRHGVPNEFFELVSGNKKIKIITDEIDIVKYVNMADIIVLPYINMIATEGNPSCLLEAMACKTSVVTTDLLELREIVEHGKDVLMAKAGDVNSLAFEINRLLKDKKLRKKLIRSSYKKVKEFDVRKVTKKFLEIYSQLK